MDTPPSLPKCEHLEPYPTASSNATELDHIRMKIGLLDNHIHQLTELRRDLHYRSLQLQNSCSPIYTLPTEVLSTIFILAAGSGTDPFFSRLELESLQANLCQSIALSAVTTHFRRVAFGIADLWKNVPLLIARPYYSNNTIALLRHCLTLAPYINLFVDERFPRRGGSLACILSLSDVTSKIKSFELIDSKSEDYWIEELCRGFFPMLDSLSLCTEMGFSFMSRRPLSFEFGALTSIVRLRINGYGARLTLPIVIPPSIQVLHLIDVPDDIEISLLKQCPNLVECVMDRHLRSFVGADREEFFEALSLTRLKRFVWAPGAVLYTRESPPNFHMPSLEYLELKLSDGQFETVHPICRHLSPTLTTLVLTNLPDTLDAGHLHQLFRIPFPKLATLEFQHLRDIEFMRSLFVALAGDEKRESLLNLKKLVLFCHRNITVHPPLLLDLLQNWSVGVTSYFCVEVKSLNDVLKDEDWPPYLLKDLRSVVGDRQIEVTWGCRKLLQCQ